MVALLTVLANQSAPDYKNIIKIIKYICYRDINICTYLHNKKDNVNTIINMHNYL